MRGKSHNGCQDQLSRKFGEAQDIHAAKPDVPPVDEAGETPESHVFTAMSKNTNQMILIGDHKLATSGNCWTLF